MSDHLRTRNYADTLFGEPVQQVWSALYWYERVIRQFKLQTVLELGTGTGMLTAYFAACVGPDRVVSCDNDPDKASNRAWRLFKDMGVVVLNLDLHDPHTVDLLWEVSRRDGPALLLVDGGDKDLEFELYAPGMRLGDVVMVHDVRIRETTGEFEFNPDAPRATKTAHDNGLVRILADELNADGTWLAAWVKTA